MAGQPARQMAQRRQRLQGGRGPARRLIRRGGPPRRIRGSLPRRRRHQAALSLLLLAVARWWTTPPIMPAPTPVPAQSQPSLAPATPQARACLAQGSTGFAFFMYAGPSKNNTHNTKQAELSHGVVHCIKGSVPYQWPSTFNCTPGSSLVLLAQAAAGEGSRRTRRLLRRPGVRAPPLASPAPRPRAFPPRSRRSALGGGVPGGRPPSPRCVATYEPSAIKTLMHAAINTRQGWFLHTPLWPSGVGTKGK